MLGLWNTAHARRKPSAAQMVFQQAVHAVQISPQRSAGNDQIIADRKARAMEYEEYLKRIAELVKKVESGQSEGLSEKLNGSLSRLDEPPPLDDQPVDMSERSLNMSTSHASALPSTLTGSLREYRVVEGSDLLKRVEGFYKWQNDRFQEGFWPYSRSTDIGPLAQVCLGMLYGPDWQSVMPDAEVAAQMIVHGYPPS